MPETFSLSGAIGGGFLTNVRVVEEVVNYIMRV